MPKWANSNLAQTGLGRMNATGGNRCAFDAGVAALISRATRSRTHEFSVDPVIVKNDVRLRFLRAEDQVEFFPRVDRRNCALIHRPIFGDMSFWQALGDKMAA
jgi:hypothetical protein